MIAVLIILMLLICTLLAVFVRRLLVRIGISPRGYWLGALGTACLPPLVYLLFGGLGNLVTYNGKCYDYAEAAWDCSLVESFANGIAWAQYVAAPLLLLLIPVVALIFAIGYGKLRSRRTS